MQDHEVEVCRRLNLPDGWSELQFALQTREVALASICGFVLMCDDDENLASYLAVMLVESALAWHGEPLLSDLVLSVSRYGGTRAALRRMLESCDLSDQQLQPQVDAAIVILRLRDQ